MNTVKIAKFVLLMFILLLVFILFDILGVFDFLSDIIYVALSSYNEALIGMSRG
jgi:hypothetical protein